MFATLQRQVVRAVPRAAINKASVLRPAVVRSFVSGRSQQKGDLEDLRAARAQFRQQVQQAQRRAPEEVEEDEEEQGEEEDYLNDDYEDEDFDELDDAPKVATVGFPAPAFSATALMPGGTFAPLHAHELAGKWTVLFFYPLDFTFVCPTEIRAFSDRFSEFEKLNVNVVAASVDSEYSHLAWTQQPKELGGLGPMNFPILADITKSISRSYGVLIEKKGIALRGLFIIDPTGVVRQSTINDLPIGRSVDETLRLIQAFQYNEEHGEVCPAGWTPGKAAMTADGAGLKKYFSKKE